MTKIAYLFLLLPFFQSCANPATEECESCDHDGTAYEILSFESTIVFDTSTVVIEGIITDLETKTGIAGAEIVIHRDTAYTDQYGNYRFHHIGGGKTAPTIKDKSGRLTKIEELDFETGKGWELNIAVSQGLD